MHFDCILVNVIAWEVTSHISLCRTLHSVFFVQLHTWVKLVGIVLAAGGAIELTVTAPHDNKTTEDSGNSTDNGLNDRLQVLGYISLLLNTFCMVSTQL